MCKTNFETQCRKEDCVLKEIVKAMLLNNHYVKNSGSRAIAVLMLRHSYGWSSLEELRGQTLEVVNEYIAEMESAASSGANISCNEVNNSLMQSIQNQFDFIDEEIINDKDVEFTARTVCTYMLAASETEIKALPKSMRDRAFKMMKGFYLTAHNGHW